MDIQSELIKTIEMMIDKKINKNSGSEMIPSVVRDINADGNRYLVHINQIQAWVKCGTDITPSVGKSVWVCIPNGNISDAFIIAYK